jgi:hypothetical protein
MGTGTQAVVSLIATLSVGQLGAVALRVARCAARDPAWHGALGALLSGVAVACLSLLATHRASSLQREPPPRPPPP